MIRTFAGSALALFVLLVALVVGCGDGTATIVSDDPPEDDPPERAESLSLPDGFTAEVFVTGLDLPTTIAFPLDGSDRLFVNELQTGRIRIVEDGELRDEPFAELETNVGGGFPVDGENGLIGLAFDPHYETNGYVYVTYARRTAEDHHAAATKHEGKDVEAWGAVARFTDVGNRGEDFTILLDSIPGKPGHQVQNLTFGPDGKLYVSVGDAYDESAAQEASSLVGKVLRMNPDGTIPADNPLPDAYTYALGLRNGFDLAFDAGGDLYITDNGPDKSDELNRVVAGGDFGWPRVQGDRDDPDTIDPLHEWYDVVSPAGMLFYDGDQFPAAYRGAMFLVLFGKTASPGPSDRSKRVRVVRDLDAEGGPSFEDFAVYEMEGAGNPIDVAQGPDGSLYLSDIFQGTIYRIRYDD